MMNLIQKLNSKQLIKEEAAGGAVGAGCIAATPMVLIGSLIKRNIPKTPKVIKFTNPNPTSKVEYKKIGIKESFYKLHEAESSKENFDASGIVAKLKSLETREDTDVKDTSTFGLVDSTGQIIKVTVPSDQATSFEQDIQHFMSDRDESEQAPEIAEVLFNMKDRYTIVNVEWPNVEEDAEEGQELQDGTEGMDVDPNAEGMPPEGELPPGDMGMGADTGGVEDLLSQVISMMTADADARKAEAQAREAEAKTKQANAARDQAMSRVKQEEQFLDMDDFTKNQKNKEKEAKRLAQLSKWKHDMGSGKIENLPAQEPQYDFLPGEENEEIFNSPQKLKQQLSNKGSTIRGKVSPTDVAKYILNRAK